MKKIIAVLLAALLVIPLGVVFSSAAETNIAKGKTYDCTGNHENYPDTGDKELTDGVKADKKEHVGYGEGKDFWTGLNWVSDGADCNTPDGFTDKTVTKNSIIVDLGSKEDNLTKFVLHSQQAADGIDKPDSVEISVSDDKKEFTKAQEATEKETAKLDDNYGIYTYTLSLSKPISARYVKFVVTMSAPWCFVSEVEVFQNSDAKPKDPDPGENEDKEPAETYSLITTDASKWKSGDAQDGETAVAAKEGDAIKISGSKKSYPYAYYNVEKAEKVNIADFKLAYDFTVTGEGKTNIVLFCEGGTAEDNKNYITGVTHLIVPDGDKHRPEGDDLLDGTYKGEIELSKLNLENVTLKEKGKLTISCVKVYSVGGGVVTINKLALESIATKEPDDKEPDDKEPDDKEPDDKEPDDKEPDDKEPDDKEPDDKEPDDENPKTGDAGIILFGITAIVSLAGIKTFSEKKRSR